MSTVAKAAPIRGWSQAIQSKLARWFTNSKGKRSDKRMNGSMAVFKPLKFFLDPTPPKSVDKSNKLGGNENSAVSAVACCDHRFLHDCRHADNKKAELTQR